MKTKIENYLQMFEVKEVDRDGEKKSIVVFANNASEELKNSVMSAHGESLPNDWIFDIYHSILDAMLQYDNIEDSKGEIVDSLVDIYTVNLTEWLNNNIYNVYYLTEALKETEEKDGFKILAIAQYIAIDEIYSEVLTLLNN